MTTLDEKIEYILHNFSLDLLEPKEALVEIKSLLASELDEVLKEFPKEGSNRYSETEAEFMFIEGSNKTLDLCRQVVENRKEKLV